MATKKGIIDNEELLGIRHALHQSFKKDIHIQEIIREIKKESTLTKDEKIITKLALNEVKQRLYYTGLLDSLWEEIEEIQLQLENLHTYRTLEKNYLSLDNDKTPLTEEESDIDTVTLNEVNLEEDALREAHELESEITEIHLEDEEEIIRKEARSKKDQNKKDKKKSTKDKDKDKKKKDKKKKKK